MPDWLSIVLAVAAAAFAAAQVWVAVLTKQDSVRQHATEQEVAATARKEEQRRVALEDRQAALSIHAELTALEVHQAAALAPTSPPHRHYLAALHQRCAARYEDLDGMGSLEGYLRSDIDRALAEIEQLDPTGTAAAAAVMEGRRRDRSRFTWEGSGSYTKHQVLQKIVLQLAAANGLDSRSRLLELLAPQLQKAVPDRKFTSDRVLWKVADADRSHQRVAAQVGPLLLDGEEYVVRNSLGFPEADYATATQRPVIDHFAARGLPVAPVG